jgi:alpha-N-acetylglucosaminidase
MQILNLIFGLLAIASTAVAAPATTSCTPSQPSTTGIQALLQRRLPQHAEKFEFSIVNATSFGENDVYAVSNAQNGKIKVEGSSLSALATGYVILSSLLNKSVEMLMIV